MTIVLGSRSRSNIVSGPANLFIAEGGTITSPANYVTNITAAAYATLKGSFSSLGSVGESPVIKIEPIKRNVIDNIGSYRSVINQVKVSSEIVIAETDILISNELITQTEATNKIDILFEKGTIAGSVVYFLMNVSPLLYFENRNTYKDIDEIKIIIESVTTNYKTLTGKYEIT